MNLKKKKKTWFPSMNRYVELFFFQSILKNSFFWSSKKIDGLVGFYHSSKDSKFWRNLIIWKPNFWMCHPNAPGIFAKAYFHVDMNEADFPKLCYPTLNFGENRKFINNWFIMHMHFLIVVNNPFFVIQTKTKFPKIKTMFLFYVFQINITSFENS